MTALGPAMPASTETVGQSWEGRAIRAVRVGNPRAKIKVLVVGEIHGNELAGRAVTKRLRKAHPPRGVEYWLIDDLNPDGAHAGTRENSHGVDLNRNFPYRWKGGGPSPLSEPESTAFTKLAKRIKPRVTIWYHQHMRLVDRSGGDAKLSRLSARAPAPPPLEAPVAQARLPPGDGHELGEPHLARLHRVRGRAAGGAAVGAQRAAPRRSRGRGRAGDRAPARQPEAQ